ncbi:hypothetical protein C7377_0980 [Balneicella halophila]|uniref:Cytokinin riboside 5'-monophosphate phosphoribohydrolase n=1 Tax=Balneicella halophila TaxID=1537566 RepID=A0A7L4USB2_BALHA|nr:TIGR00730 family Rossman fold protein [Balneicella halophila]PVX52650.1 hypothetical protein C7377_0980 [Balneicella halophila]
MNIAVYCSSSDAIADKYFADARKVGKAIAKAGHTLLYGGTFMGLMGALAKENMKYGGKRVGVICEKIIDMEGVVLDDENLLTVETLSLRKAKLVELADAHVVLPGGFGTLDEAMSILAMKQVGESEAPVVFLSTDGFYTSLQLQFQKFYKEFFAGENFKEAYHFINKVEELCELIAEFR